LISDTSTTLEDPVNRFALLGEMWSFMRERKKWWLMPIVTMLVLLGALLVFAKSSALAPFIYTVF
jgi:hypothetical protein